MSSKEMKFNTTAVHAGERGTEFAGAVIAPIFQTSTYEYSSAGSYNEVKYLRLNNSPNHEMLHEKIAALEGGEAAVVTASGMAAIATTILTVCEEPGGHLLTQNCLYGGSQYFFNHDFIRMGHSTTSVDMNNPDTWTKSLKPGKTRAFYVESITNPMLEVADFERVIKFCKDHGILSIIDNTIASPVNFNPISLGFDIVVHSATKYLNGHSDLVAGCVVASKKWIKPITIKLNYLGGCLDTHACYLLNRGIKTMGLRVKQQNENALALAKWLEKHPKVSRVLYPGIESHPDHKFAKKYMRGFGGMLCFEYKGSEKETDQFLARLKLPKVAPSLGGVESLVTRPSTTSHSGVGAAERARIGLSDVLIRFSVGIEDADDLIADFQQAFG